MAADLGNGIYHCHRAAAISLSVAVRVVGGGMNWLISRLREPSTWRGIVWLATVAGLSLRPDQAEAIVAAGMALAGLLGVFLADEPKTVVELPPIDLQGRSESVNVPAGSQSMQSANGVCVPVPSQNPPRPYSSADPNTYPRFGNGFGDRD